jgi:hypothetical protein
MVRILLASRSPPSSVDLVAALDFAMSEGASRYGAA